MGVAARETTFPDEHEGLVERCTAAGQHEPTPLLLRYGPGGYNCLHQDVYGELVFPVRTRPRHGARGYHRVQMRHGVSAVRSGPRHVLGIIFHNAR